MKPTIFGAALFAGSLFVGSLCAQHICTEMHDTPPPLPDGAVSLAGDRNKFWSPGQTITVKFMGGSAYVRQKVRQYAMTWTNYANINFQFVDDNASAMIRISFQQGAGSWSYIGKDALNIASDKPTMNFGWFHDNTTDTEFSRTTIHEFGHALGLIHEHAQPAAGIPWDKEKVYAYYAKQGWSRDDVDRNLFRRYNQSTTQYSQYDKFSIMHYAVSNELTIGDYEVPWNTSLSAIDKSFIGKIYPKSGTPNPSGTVQPRSLAAGWYGIPFPSIDAATEYSDGRTYLFYGDKYVQWNYDNKAYLEPKDLRLWKGITFNRIDAAFYWEPTGKVYLFSGSQYVRYDVKENKTDEGYPVNIKTYWKGANMFDRVDAAVAWDDSKVYFFKGNQYLRYDMKLDKVDEGYPLTLNSTNWKGVQFTKIDAVLKWKSPTVYLFSGGQYHRFDIEKNTVY